MLVATPLPNFPMRTRRGARRRRGVGVDGSNKRRLVIDTRGQSLVELGLALPLLLMLLLGLVDGARAYYFASNIANAAREAANYAARNSSATQAQVTQRACDQTALAPFGQPCVGLQVTCTTTAADVAIEVRYDFQLMTGYVVDSLFHVNPVPIRATARFPLLTSGTPCAS